MSAYRSRASYNISKKGSPTHNDLTGTYQDHIDYELSKSNVYVTYDFDDEPVPNFKFKPKPKDGFLKHELKSFWKYFKDAHDDQVKKYEEARQKSRAEGLMKKWYDKSVEEEILQWGNEGTPGEFLPSPYEMSQMIHEFNMYKCSVLKSEQGGYIPLDFAVHHGETTDHVHNRGVFFIINEDGHPRPGDKKNVLLAAGIKAPDDDFSIFDQIEDEDIRKKAIKAYERYNNPSVTFERMCREKWQDILEKHGFSVIREPVKGERDLQDTKEKILNKFLNGEDVKIEGDTHKTVKEYRESRARQESVEAEKMRAEIYEETKIEAENSYEDYVMDGIIKAESAVKNADDDAEKIRKQAHEEAEKIKKQAEEIRQNADNTLKEAEEEREGLKYERRRQKAVNDCQKRLNAYEQEDQMMIKIEHDRLTEIMISIVQMIQAISDKILHREAEEIRQRQQQLEESQRIYSEDLRIVNHQVQQAESYLDIPTLQNHKQQDRSL